MKKIFTTFLILIINFSLLHMSFAQVGSDILPSNHQCSEYNLSQQHNNQENTFSQKNNFF